MADEAKPSLGRGGKLALSAVIAGTLGVGIYGVLRMSSEPTQPQEWSRTSFEAVGDFGSPVTLHKTDAQGIDTDFGEWKGEGLTVRIDYGIYADPLMSYRDRDGYEELTEEIDGRMARIVSFRPSNGGRFAAAHFKAPNVTGGRTANRLTMTVEAAAMVGEDVPLRIIRSLKFK